MSNDGLQSRLKALSPEQIRQLMARRHGAAAAPAPLQAAADGSLPVSLAQERFWFLSRLYPDTPDYNIPLAVRIDGEGVDRATLQRNLDAVVAAHEVFRTSFHARGDGVVQVVQPVLEVEVEFEDRSAEGEGDAEELALRLAREHGARIFATDRAPLFAVKLVRLGAARHLLLLNIHHLISDGWSNSLLSQSLTAPAGSIAPPARQYRDFVAHERAWLHGPECRAQLAFWQELLHDAPAPPEFGRRERGAQANAGGLVSRELPAGLCERITGACSTRAWTPFQYFMGCFAMLMTRFAAADDLVIGTPVANRNLPQFMQTCGLFINTLPLRFRIDPRRGFADTLAECARRIERCLAHQELPYAELVKHVQVRRTLDENPLFNVHFAFQYFPHQKASRDFRLLAVDHGYGKFDLNVFAELSGAGNRITLSYRDRAFTRADVERIADAFVHVLEHGLSECAGAGRERAVPPAGERWREFLPAAGLAILRGPQRPRPKRNWYSLFEAAARRHPHRSACVDAHGTLDYAGLEAHVTRAAIVLASRGVACGDRVLLHAQRDRHFLVGMLACMRLGAAWLPLAPDAPPALLDAIQDEAGARLALGPTRTGRLPCLAFEALLAGAPDAVALPPVPDAAGAACILYTSGSTGAPKGVVVTHAGLVNYTLALLERLDDPQLASYAHLSALDADLGNTAIFGALASGAALLLPPAQALLDAQALADFLSRHPADVAKVVPSHLRAMRAHLARVLPRRVLVCGGEALDGELVAAIRACAPSLRIFNHYGPTEATIGVLMHEVDPREAGTPPLGTPIANAGIRLLDPHGRPVPFGTPGEIGITGAGLAAGYLGPAEGDASRFVEVDGERMYRTGDLAVLDADGAVMFLGRVDHRVKIAGVFVQPEVVSSWLLRHPAVAAAHVWTEEGADGNLRLRAAVVAHAELDAGALRAHLLQRCKPAQCPTLVSVPALPLNANGKVDARALRRLAAEPAPAQPAGLPRDICELAVQNLFRQALGLSSPPRDASFFDLGGTSLQAIALIARINDAFTLQLPVAVLFENGSVQGLAEIVRRHGHGTAPTPLVALADDGQQDVIAWVHPAGGNAMCYLPLARQLAPRRASLAFAMHGSDASRDSRADIGALARDYHRCMGEQYATRRVVLAGWSMGALVAHEMAVLAAEEGRSVPLLLLDQPVPDPAAAPLGHDERVMQYLEKVEVFTGHRIDGHLRDDGGLDHERLLHAFQRLDLVPADTGVDAFRGFLDLLVFHNGIVAAFRPRALSAPALLLRARETIHLRHGAPPAAATADLGWGRHCTQLVLGEAEGNHMTMLATANAAPLAAAIEGWLARLP